MEKYNEYLALVKQAGAQNAAVVNVSDIETDKAFRDICATNACGKYGKCWTCPPDIGEINELIRVLRGYSVGIVYQTVAPLEDSFDFEGMMAAGQYHNALVQSIRTQFDARKIDALHLGAGGCRVCETCAKVQNKPCRFPDKAIGSLEAYGINVSKLAALAGMKYINGTNTVTYFGAVFL